MASPTRRSAVGIHWSSPDGESLKLSPMSDGLLEIEMHDDLVTVHSRNCTFRRDDEEVSLAAYEISFSLHRCQIDWLRTERTEETEIERSAYFKQ